MSWKAFVPLLVVVPVAASSAAGDAAVDPRRIVSQALADSLVRKLDTIEKRHQARTRRRRRWW